LFALYKTNAKPTRREIDDALAGNLCRCTGYRPIIAAAEAMYEAQTEVDWLRQPGAKASAQKYKPPSERIAALQSLRRTESMQLHSNGRRFFAPTSADEFAGLLAAHPDATILAGGTDIGLWVTKQHRELDTVIYTGRVAELNELNTSATHIEIGAAVSLSDAMVAIVEHYPALDEVFTRFASPPIRNAGTCAEAEAVANPPSKTFTSTIRSRTCALVSLSNPFAYPCRPRAWC